MNKSKIKIYLFSIFFFVLTFYANAQLDISSTNKKAIAKFNKAKASFFQKDFSNSIKYAQKAIDLDEKFLEAYLILSESYIEMEDLDHAIVFLEKMLDLNTSKYGKAWRLLAELYMEQEEYQKAVSAFETYVKTEKDNTVNQEIETCKFRMKQMENPQNIKLINPGKNINTEDSEYINAISLDENSIYFTVKPEKSALKNEKSRKRDEDFYFSQKKEQIWGERKAFDTIINTRFNEGALHVSADNRFLFFTSCRDRLGFGSCDLYFTSRQNDSVWNRPFNLGQTINSVNWDTQPCFSSDGKTLFFVSNRENGYGQSDIWYATLKPDGTWHQPKNLGNTINTLGDEMAPYLHPDGKTLYFSSNGHMGMGGMDIFISKKINDTTWSKPINLGYPINTKGNEINLIVNAKGNVAYMSVEKSTGNNHYDIYYFDLPQPYMAEKTAYIKGNVLDSITQKPVQAVIELIDLQKQSVKVLSATQPDGSYLIALPTGKSYALHVKKKGYMFYNDHFDFNHQEIEPKSMDILLHPIQDNLTAELKNIFFAFDSDELLPSSKPELNTLINVLKTNPQWKITILGYTDNKGTQTYNQKLSENRAKSVYQYLIENGVEKQRLSYIGMGEKNPKADNETEAGRAKNRRTEIVFNKIQ